MSEHVVKIHKWLYPVSWIYKSVVAMRNKLFDWGVFQSKSFNIPVICVGNLAVGGTGKTPHTEYLIKLLRDNYQVAILSRGYKRRTSGYVLATPQSTVKTIGDEPYQMHTKFPSVTLAVDENRCHGIEKLLHLKEPTVDVILLDDAFQHRYVKPGLSILLTDYHRLFCDDTLLPAGRLRESINGKNRAQIVIVTKCPQDIKPIDYNIITKRLNLYPYQQLFFSSFRYGNLRPVFSQNDSDSVTKDSSNKEVPLSSLTDANILLVTGIASPTPILERLKEFTQNIDLLSFGDHHDFSHRDIQLVKERFKKLKSEQRIIITTEKDATRLLHHPAVNEGLKPFIYALPIEIEILQNQQDKFNQHIINYVRENTRNRSLS
ncbi:lipid-A-disaccharide kinase [Bacteroides faecichinchillae]|uniref:Tetraacyldisaccharide 4'-kinase n=1 Tax=Bacteroides faecichinchillae TaxID=871325 RepID=A0A1M5FU27_9BACE|nr:tetraacyldisaccharide 4'-kinase [Bacteroides faecichinchillae]THG57701.1 tetraacyldisaccharide 4'-kinase [Bacteroides faecichinchillae]SHF95077.1 lipid-A-disaccharide kinase [Bacteroides faecichinchillae]